MPVSDYHYTATDHVEIPAHEPVAETAHEPALSTANQPVAVPAHQAVSDHEPANPYHVPGFTHVTEATPSVTEHHAEAPATAETTKHS